jgi:hypothetical protein
MKRARFPIAGLMAAVAAIAINLAVMRSFDETKPESLPHLFFACGVTSMASLLILVGLASLPNLVRGGRLSPFVFGFETLGWVAVFAFVTVYSMTPASLLAFTEWIGTWTRPILIPLTEHSPRWVQMSAELGFGTVLFSLPELIIALLGGWVARKVRLTARLELGAMERAVCASDLKSDTAGPHASVESSIDPSVSASPLRSGSVVVSR